MKTILTLILIALSITVNAATYYFSNSGNNSNTGLSDAQAWATLDKLASVTVGAGDSVLFKRGHTFRGWFGKVIGDGGSASDELFYGAYGTGAKPIIKSSISLNQESDWTNISGNIWESTVATLTADVGSLIFNNGYGVKKQTSAECTTQGDFWYNFTNDLVRIYSESNPSIYYSSIEAAIKVNGIVAHFNDYVTYSNLVIMNAGAHGIDCYDNKHITITDCEFYNIGGCDLYDDYTVRYGNGVQFYYKAEYCTVKNCKFKDLYDNGMTTQSWESDAYFNVIIFKNNVVENTEWCYEFVRNSTVVIDSVFYINNTSINAGKYWAHNDRWGNGELSAHIMSWGGTSATVTNVVFRNNIFVQEDGIDNLPGAGWNAINMFGTSAAQTGITCDYNLFYLNNLGEDHNAFTGLYNEVNLRTLTNWQTSGFDEHSVEGDPLFTNATNYADVTLQATSPAIDAGVDVGLPYNGTAPDIGAFEYGEPTYNPTVSPTILRNKTPILHKGKVLKGNN